jgi:DNA repair ATPase RecN
MNQPVLHSQPAGSIGVLPDLVGITSQGTTSFMAMRIHSATNKLQNKGNKMSYLESNTDIFDNLPASSDLEHDLESVRTLVDDIGQQLEDKVREIESVKEQIDSDFSAAEDAISLLVDVVSKLETLDTAIEEIEALDIDISI